LATEPILVLEDVVAGYGPITILHRLDLAVAPARITTMIGPNGAGKSTVLKTIFGLLPLASGNIRFAGERIVGLGPRALLARGIAYVPQGRNLFPELSVRHNLELGGTTLADRHVLARRMAAVMVRFPVLEEKADMQASTLSGGEQKMLEIARVLLLEPRLILIDEPSIGLAPNLVSGVFRILEELRALLDSGATMLVGASGVGKSSLVNALVGHELLETGEVRGDAKGRHVTTARELVLLPDRAGMVLDTPGIRSIGLWEAERALDEVFGDLQDLATECRFSDCSHESEPGCVISSAVDSGKIDRLRVDRFKAMSAELAGQREREDQRARRNEKDGARGSRRRRRG